MKNGANEKGFDRVQWLESENRTRKDCEKGMESYEVLGVSVRYYL